MANPVRVLSGIVPRAERWRCLLALFCALVLPGPMGDLMAGQLDEMKVTHVDGVYQVRVQMQIDAPPSYVYQVLTDFRHIYRLNPAITESEIMTPSVSGAARVRTRIEDCVLIRCMSIQRTETVHINGREHLHVVTDPETSDFKSGTTDWWIRPAGEGTRIIHQSAMEPDFYIPPVIGQFVMKRKLRDGILKSLRNIECIARVRAGLETEAFLPVDGYPYLAEEGCGR